MELGTPKSYPSEATKASFSVIKLPVLVFFSVVVLLMGFASAGLYTKLKKEPENQICAELNPSNKENYFVVSILLEGIGENATTEEEIKEIRKDFESLGSNIKVTWSMTNDFVFHEEHRSRIELIKSYVDKYGDEIGIAYAFPNNNETEKSWKIKMDEWMNRFLYNGFNDIYELHKDEEPFNFIPEKYKPTSVSSYLINPLQAKHMQQEYGISSFMGVTSTQYNVDQLSALGSPLMPYYVNDRNVLVPTQEENTNDKMFFINTLTIDPVGSRYTTGESRWTIHPADPSTDGMEQIYIINSYLKNPFKDKNTVNYLSLLIEPNWVLRTNELKNAWTEMIKYFKDKQLFNITGVREFNQVFDCLVEKDSYNSKFALFFTGSGVQKSGNNSDNGLTYFWTETKSEKIILEKKGERNEWRIIDFTDYTGDIPLLPFTTNSEDVSYVKGRDYKISSDAGLTGKDFERIRQKLREIGFWEEVVYE